MSHQFAYVGSADRNAYLSLIVWGYLALLVDEDDFVLEDYEIVGDVHLVFSEYLPDSQTFKPVCPVAFGEFSDNDGLDVFLRSVYVDVVE